jgi:hypothetical protein
MQPFSRERVGQERKPFIVCRGRKAVFRFLLRKGDDDVTTKVRDCSREWPWQETTLSNLSMKKNYPKQKIETARGQKDIDRAPPSRSKSATMAAIPALQNPLHQEEEQYEILSDDQIQALLQEAETRLREAESGQVDSRDQMVIVEPAKESYTGPKYVSLSCPLIFW